jgi:hypothetical protein
MSPLVKKALAAVAAKQVIDKINERRSPKRSRFGRLLLLVGGTGAAVYAYKSGLLQPLIDKVSGKESHRSSSSNGAGKGEESSFRESRSLGAPVA